ncbi:hypothetical protein TRAPUB_9912 [Trametes pubescens]|uniref:Uncharacterized protein n=1 Tax=Trametes pubescens TaxID=154538 RepID=A0A1M2W133_TRAPU|nr:hypothetical protein TRAPUB_9912 [Trametes pubescens]
MATPAPNPRASLLAGLRTGGVRSASGPIPHTAAPSGTFNIPRIITPNQEDNFYPPEEEDELSNMMNQNMYIQNGRTRQAPLTAAVDGIPNRFLQQQQQQQQQQQSMNMNGSMNFNPLMSPAMAQNQLQQVQLQLMQMELARMQAIQAQQYQAELLAQAQAQAQQRRGQPQQNNRRAASYVVPSTAGPMNTTFDMRAVSAQAQMRRANQADQLRSKLGVTDEQVPMTAAINGKFGSRMPSSGYDYEDDFSMGARVPATPSYTTVISGGTSLGGMMGGNGNANNNGNGNVTNAPSKSDTAVSWRRAGNNSVLGGNRAVSSPAVRITPPPSERVSPPPGLIAPKVRPQPLRFTAETSAPTVSAVAIDADGGDGDDSSVSSRSNSSPSTPNSTTSGDVPLSPREEAAKKLYEGLGLGRSVPTINVVVPQDSQMVVHRLVSTPVRQPRGPPSNNEELVPKNFATRSRRRAVGALLEHARERREIAVEAF